MISMTGITLLLLNPIVKVTAFTLDLKQTLNLK